MTPKPNCPMWQWQHSCWLEFPALAPAMLLHGLWIDRICQLVHANMHADGQMAREQLQL